MTQRTELKDVLHLYLGQQCETDDGKRGRLAGIDLCQMDNSIVMITVRFTDDPFDNYDVYNDNEKMDRVKPILRRLQSMMEDEAVEMYNHLYPNSTAPKVVCADIIKSLLTKKGLYNEGQDSFIEYVDWFPYLLSKSFDLFGLIDSGQAIDADTLKQQV